VQEKQSLHARILATLLDEGYSKQELAQMAGLSGPRMIDYTLQGGVKQISQKAISNIARHLGTTTDLLYAKAASYNNLAPRADDFLYVPLRSAHPKCGQGGEETEADIINWFAFRQEWLLRHGNPERMSLFKVTGDSMETTLKNDDMILVDESQVTPIEGVMFLVLVNNQLMVKRISQKPDGLEFISDNPRHTPIFVSNKDESNSVVIHGRVVWMARDF